MIPILTTGLTSRAFNQSSLMAGAYIKDIEEFEPQTLRILGKALDDAWQRVKRNHLNGMAYAARRVLAQHIYAMAKQGERDPRHLIDGALTRLKL